MNVWYKKLGYYENPFLMNPMKEKTKMYGNQNQLDDVLYYVKSGSMLFVEGSKGIGKTKFLRTVISSFKGRIIYVDAASLTKNLNIEELLRKRNGLKGKVLGKKPMDMILVLDNVTELSSVNIERIKFYYDQGFLQSVIMAGTTTKHLHDSILNRIGKRVIKLSSFTKQNALDMAFERLDEDINDDEPLITKEHIEKIYEASSSNPRLFLINLHRVFEEMDFEDAQVIENDHLKVLEDTLDKEDEVEFEISLGAQVYTKETQFKDKDGNDVVKVGEYYRSPVHDVFCGNCGAIVSKDAVSCPECFAKFENNNEKENLGGEAHA
jgi:energy-coupling factor transporter ATP-binding protein EcfA2